MTSTPPGPSDAARYARGAGRMTLRCLRLLGRMLAQFGLLWIPVPPSLADDGRSRPPVRVKRDPGGPALYHPERLCPDIPLTALERALQRQLWVVDDEHPGNPPVTGGRA
ncbi:DUF6059 family protein [Streptomyces cyanogenus]|uniref:Uncharacterized protein n=1 Tax=Streptomyces cyanogenus TaxID=80860 RepID=A0ABX7TP90_STRCY|nr:DUF6059 family protein [Streptomyces cyanogenus]QTD96689.1 hypothetical protein S1361_04965 [Streptomyces cyanogenus]